MANLEFDVVYEGSESVVTITNLKPLTEYTFKVRFGFLCENSTVWSQTYGELKVQTCDESQVNKAILQLIRAVQENDSPKVASLIEEFGAQLSMAARDKNGRTLPMIAAQQGNTDIMRLLIANGADLKSTTQAGKTALSIAITNSQYEVVKQLLLQDKTLASHTDINGVTMLMLAAENSIFAFRKGYETKILQEIIDAGVDLNQEDMNGATALDRLCTSCGLTDAADWLISHGALVVNTVSKKHPLTHLMLAAMNGHGPLCTYLLENHRGDPFMKSEHGITALSFAESANHRGVIAILTKAMKSEPL
ncbi:ankyrin repeat-containing domain protein [Globomyces pollinis-pini]|nr:ankyrin repeat-containing domain protein [Globomyces pollinis-pini]